MNYELTLPKQWVSAQTLEYAMRGMGEPHAQHITSAEVTFPSGCKVMVDAGARLLSLVNQLAYRGCVVVLDFESGESGVMGYLSRNGFLDLLHPDVDTVPERPKRSGAQVFAGSNPNLIEFVSLSPSEQRYDTPTKLAECVTRACQKRSDVKRIGDAAFTIFSELIDNIYRHSETEIDGYASVQVHDKWGKALAVVSDSGKGLLDTLRPTLREVSLRQMSDRDLILYMLTEGVSRFGKAGGAGLRQCAEYALRFRSKLDIRLSQSCLTVSPKQGGYQSGMAELRTNLPYYKGTHISFEFQLDEPK